MSEPLKWMIGSDFHIPYENPRYMKIWWDVMDWFRPDVIDINGDLSDDCPVSRFAKGKPDETLNAVVTYAPLVQKFFETCRDKCDGQIYYHTGNHEARHDAYIDSNAPAYRGLITPELLWKTDTYGIELSYYNNLPVHRFGDIHCHHGLYVSKDGGMSAKKMVDEFGVSVMSGHSHRQGIIQQKYELRNETLRAIELGHMTDVTSPGMNYTTHHPWNAGFAVGWIEDNCSFTKDGYYPHIELVTINEDFECYVAGKKFSA